MQVSKKSVFALLLLATIGYFCFFYEADHFDQMVIYSRSLVYKINFRDDQQVEAEKCEVIHVGIICNDYKFVSLHTMLKSLYFYRNNPLHFHIMVNEVSEKVLKTLFESWDVPQVEVNYYKINNYVSNVKWKGNKNHSDIYESLKLMFPKAISTNITNRIILLDTDLTFLGNIHNLWKIFDDFNTEQVLGLVELQNDYDLENFSLALEKRFHPGVILYDLEKIKKIKWDFLWTSITPEVLPNLNKTDQEDHEIINSFLKKNSQLVYALPCQWNIQLTNQSDPSNCYDITTAQILHLDSSTNISGVNEDVDFLKATYKTFLGYNGDLLRRDLIHCLNGTKISKQGTFRGLDSQKLNLKTFQDTTIDECYKFNEAANLKRRTLLYFKEFKYTPEKNDVTFVSQLSFDRLHLVEEISKVWDGPISLTLYLTDSELKKCIKFIEESEVLQNRSDIAYHAVFKRGQYYVFNELRNISLHNVVTPYVFLVDIDLLPPKYLYPKLKEYIGKMSSMYKKAFIVPAFETNKSFPQSKKELLEMWAKHTVEPFHMKRVKSGHGPTNFQKFKTAVEPYKVDWKMHFEPYIVVQNNVTGYDKRFVEFGFDKCSFIMELAAQYYEFIVLSDAFVVHKAHPVSSGVKEFKKSSNFGKCVSKRIHEFVQDLNKKYNRTF